MDLETRIKIRTHAQTVLRPRWDRAIGNIALVKDKGKSVTPFASGVFVQLNDDVWMLTASHIMKGIGPGSGDAWVWLNNKWVKLAGRPGCWTKPDAYGQYPEDYAAFNMGPAASCPPEVEPFQIQDIDIPYRDYNSHWYFAIVSSIGSKPPKSARHNVSHEAWYALGGGKEDHQKRKLRPSEHVVLHLDRKMATNDEGEHSPSAKGASGGAIIRLLDDEQAEKLGRQWLLRGIFTDDPGKVMYGTHIRYHLWAIAANYPEAKCWDEL